MRVKRSRSERGASAPEMALILLLVVVVAFSAVRLFGFQVGGMWRDIADGTGAVHRPAPADNGGHNPGNTGGGGSGIPGVPDDTTTTTTTTAP
jgi:Flp pilus assembly pilin Flp